VPGVETIGGAVSESAESDIERLHDLRWWTLAVLCLSLLIVFVGNSSLNVTLPTLSRELHATESQLQWVVASYSLVFAGLLFSTGALGDRFGRKGTLQIGLVLFLVAATLASASTTMWALIGCRAVMGAAAALIMPSTLSIIINVFPSHERPKAIAIWASITGAAGGFGPLISGWLLGHFWYGSVFLVNVPIVATALVAGKFLVPRSRDPQEARLDPVGAVLSIIGIVALVYGLIEAPGEGWASTPTLVAFGIALVVLTAFTFWELHTDEPMLDIRFFRNPAFSTGTAGMTLVFLALYGVMFLVTQYFQLVLGYSPLSAAARLLPMALTLLVISLTTPKIVARFGAHRTVATGMLSLAFGLLLLSATGTETPYWYIVLCFLPFSAGMALAMSPMTASIMSAVPARRAGMGSAMNDATREFGAALGVAVLGSIAASRYGAQIASSVAGLSTADQTTATSSIAGALNVASGLTEPAASALTDAAQHAFLSGMHLAVLIGATVAAISAAIVYRYLPHSLVPEGALHGPIESLEDAAELGLGGVPPVFADGS
jgi:MFS transporter, DHA2 family, integral membrane protein